MMKQKVEGCSCNLFYKYYTTTCLEELKKTMTNLSQDSQPLGQESNPVSLKYEARTFSWRLKWW